MGRGNDRLVVMMMSSGATGAGGFPERTEPVALPEPARAGEVSLEETLVRRRSLRSYASGDLSLATIGQLAWAAQGISDRARGFRTVPSAGATYPLELDLLIQGVEGLDDGVYRYRPDDHALQRRIAGGHRETLCHAAYHQPALRDAPVAMGISGVIARTAWRYGERAERYVHMEAGHAAQNVYLQGVALGVGTVTIGAFDDGAVSRTLQLADGEVPLYLLPLGRQ